MSKILAYALMAFVAFGLVKGTYEWFTEPPKPSQTPSPPKVEQSTEKPKPKPEVKRPEKSLLSESYNEIQRITGHYVTDSWILEYDEHIDANGNIATHGFVEVDDDGVKRRFWMIFDASGQKVLRLKIDSQLIYSADGK